MQVSPVGRSKTFPTERASKDCEDHIDNGHTKNQQRNKQRSNKEIRLAADLSCVWVGATTDHAGRNCDEQTEQQWREQNNLLEIEDESVIETT